MKARTQPVKKAILGAIDLSSSIGRLAQGKLSHSERQDNGRPYPSRNREGRCQGRQVKALDALSETANLFAIPHLCFPLKDEDQGKSRQSLMDYVSEACYQPRFLRGLREELSRRIAPGCS